VDLTEERSTEGNVETSGGNGKKCKLELVEVNTAFSCKQNPVEE
jgi:hypothetical protein